MGEPAGLAEEQLRALDRLKPVPGIERFYLAGGSAVGWHLGHRRSADLDLFADHAAVDLESVRAGAASAIASFEVVAATDVALKVRVDGVVVDLVRYPYPPLSPPVAGPVGFPVVGLRDLGAMKLAAIARRGIRRDFWDLHAIVTSGIALPDLARAYESKFGRTESDLYHVMRALTYFADAEKDPLLPEGMTPDRWASLKAFFRCEAPKLLAGP